jgi:hypothetical protein
MCRKAVDPKVFIAGMIQIMWRELLALWPQHIDDLHKADIMLCPSGRVTNLSET